MSSGNVTNKYGTIKAEKISVSEIETPSTTITGIVGTLKLSENLEIGGDGMILQDLEEFISDDNGETITYADTSTATATVVVTAGETGTNTLTSSVSKEITTPEEITLNSKTFKITQTGTTVTMDQTTTKKIVSLEQGNLVLATYDVTTGARTEKEVIFDSNNSIAEINNAAYNMEVLSLDVTTAATAGTGTPGAGNARIDGTLEVNAGITVKNGATSAGFVEFYEDSDNGTNKVTLIGPASTGDVTLTLPAATDTLVGKATVDTFTNKTFGNFIIEPTVVTTLSTTEGSPTALDETKSVIYLDLNNASAMYGILSAPSDGLILNIFYDNENASGSARIDFGATKLRSGGGGNNRYLTFDTTGQSAQLIYVADVTKWCITNTGGAVS